jgi:aminopeptidase YwaD
MKKILFLLFALFAVAPLASSAMAGGDSVFIDRQRVLNDIKYLSSDELEGRASGTRGNVLAANFIYDRFRSLGLEPAFDNTYFQEFEFPSGTLLGSGNDLKILNASQTLQVGKDFTPLGFSSPSKSATPLQVVFAGYGVEASGKVSYNDYENLDVKGKAVLMMRNSPDGSNPHSDFYEFSDVRYKAIKARDKGAVLVLVFNGYLDGKEKSDDDKLIDFQQGSRSGDAGIAIISITRSVAERITGKSEKELTDLQRKINETRKPASVLALRQVTFATDVVREKAITRNVIGILRGSDERLKNEFIVIGGHYDHLGYGGPGSGSLAPDQKAIHHGADDNASGTAGVMELARVLSQNRSALKRSIVFVCFSGEEIGLLGSAYYVKNPPASVPLSQTVAMLNMDMIGHMKDSSLAVQGMGTAAEWKSFVPQDNTGNLKLKFSDDGYGPSDHSSFYSKDLSVLFFFTGNHAGYHKPTDTWDKINADGEAMVLAFVKNIALDLASQAARPTFTKAKTDTQARTTKTGFRVSLGSIPDYSSDVEGVRLDGVREGSTAEKAGLKAGDIIIQFGDKPVKNIYDYTYALQDCNVGDERIIKVRRGNEIVEIKVKFEPKK